MSCQKDPVPPVSSLTGQLDSIISGDVTAKFIYDAQGRVIEDIFKRGDTVKERNIYFYEGASELPVKREFYHLGGTTPKFTSVIKYNAAGQKIADSTYEGNGIVLQSTFSYFGSK